MVSKLILSVVGCGFTTDEFESHSGKVYSIQHYAGTLVSFTNKSDHHDITEILLKVSQYIITLTPDPPYLFSLHHRLGLLTKFVVIGSDYTGSCKSNYYTITTTMAPK
jgi:hypothetical protein